VTNGAQQEIGEIEAIRVIVTIASFYKTHQSGNNPSSSLKNNVPKKEDHNLPEGTLESFFKEKFYRHSNYCSALK